jgi:hypothetical protein
MVVNTLPKILIIDDVFGSEAGKDDRDKFCATLKLKQLTIKAMGEPVPPSWDETGFLACVAFESGQAEDGDGVTTNEWGKALKAVEDGWKFPDGSRWALVCVDLNFEIGYGNNTESVPFGVELLKQIRRRWPAGSENTQNSSGTQIPVVMLSGDDPVEVEDWVKSEKHVSCVRKWQPTSVDPQGRDALKEFGMVLFAEALTENGSLRYVGPNSEVKCVQRASVSILDGASLPILYALRYARRLLSTDKSTSIVITGSKNSGQEQIADYLSDHRVAASEYYYPTAAKGYRIVYNNIKKMSHEPMDASDSQDFNVIDYGARIFYDFNDRAQDQLAALSKVLSSSRTFQIIVTDTEENVESAKGDPIYHAMARELFPLKLPPLSNRREDINRLFKLLLSARADPKLGYEKTWDEDVTQRITEHDWPGGFPELKKVVAYILSLKRHARMILKADVDEAIRHFEHDGRTPTIGSFADLLAAIKGYNFESHEVNGAWPDLRGAIGVLLSKLFEKVGDVSPGAGGGGRYNRTGVWRTIGGNDSVESSKAEDEIKNLAKNFPINASVLEKLMPKKNVSNAE